MQLVIIIIIIIITPTVRFTNRIMDMEVGTVNSRYNEAR